MTNTHKLTGLALTGLVAALAGAHPAAAQVVTQTPSITDGTEVAYGPYPTSLIQIGASTYSGETLSGGLNFGTIVSGLNDGSVGVTGGLSNTTAGQEGQSYVVTFTLNTTGNTLGYTVTGIDTSVGWGGARANQSYSVSYATVAAPAVFTPLLGASVNYFVDANPYSAIDHSTEVALGITGLTGVSALQFTFNSVPAAGGSYATIYREVGVFGSPTLTTTPEPSQTAALGLGVLGLAGLALKARKRRAA